MVLSGGTADLPVVAVAIATLMGHAPEQLIDVGVAGLHRLLDHLDVLCVVRVIIVVTGLTAAPVLAVPTSTGYGAAFDGLAPLRACAPGVTVLNIDNGFGAEYQAALINALAMRRAD